MNTLTKTLPSALILLAASTAYAQDDPSGRGRTFEPEPDDGAYEHDGFYLRLGFGIGLYREMIESEEQGSAGGETGGEATSGSTVYEVALGGTVAPGFVLGLGLFGASSLGSSYEPSEGTVVPDEVVPDRRELTLVGPFVDWFPSVDEGFHVHGAIGFASLDDGLRGAEGELTYHANGAGIMFGMGHEWFVSEQWSVGAMGRLVVALASGTDDAGVRYTHFAGTLPSLLLTATYH